MTRAHFAMWQEAFFEIIREPVSAGPLKAASLAEDLKAWTGCLTDAVAASCRRLGWMAAARGHRLTELPQPGQEYLNLDVMAFAAGTAPGPWRFPVAVFELENSLSDDRVAYSLWKVLCVRTPLRVVFAFRRNGESSRRIVDVVCRDVIGSMSVTERAGLTGDTVLIVGNRGEGETFPWGYFKTWLLDSNVGRFEKI